MNGLIVVGGMLIGGGVGGMAGLVAAMFWADMEIGSMDAPMMVGTGVVVGAGVGAYVTGQLVS